MRTIQKLSLKISFILLVGLMIFSIPFNQSHAETRPTMFTDDEFPQDIRAYYKENMSNEELFELVKIDPEYVLSSILVRTTEQKVKDRLKDKEFLDMLPAEYLEFVPDEFKLTEQEQEQEQTQKITTPKAEKKITEITETVQTEQQQETEEQNQDIKPINKIYMIIFTLFILCAIGIIIKLTSKKQNQKRSKKNDT